MDNKTRVTLAATVLSFTLGACTFTQQVSHETFRPPEGSYRVIVMQPDITVSLLTAGGGLEPREDWTNQAREHMLKSLAEQQAARGGDITIATTREEMGGDATAVADLIWLHKAVGQAIQVHKYLSVISLPTKKYRFDWTLGHTAVEYGAATHYDYALFVHAEDSFASGGRTALIVADALACAFGICMFPAGGQQTAFASLVDLKTGYVVWFNMLASNVGDIRTREGADAMVKSLLGDMKAGKPPAYPKKS